MVGSALSAATGSIPVVDRHVDGIVQLALLRALQGIGAGGLWVLVLSILGDMFGPRKRSEYISYMLSGFGAALVIRPARRRLVDRTPLVALDFPHQPPARRALARARLGDIWTCPRRRWTTPSTSSVRSCSSPRSRRSCWRRRGVAESYAWTSVTILGLFALTVVLAVAFVIHEIRTPEPIFPIEPVS